MIKAYLQTKNRSALCIALVVLEELQRIEQYVEMVLGFLRLESNSTDYVIRKERVDEILREWTPDAVDRFPDT